MPEETKPRKAPAKPRKTTAKAKLEVAETKPVTASNEKPVAVSHTVSHEEIRRLAHQYWIDGGHRQGHQHEDWARAEAELRRRAS
jgi:hypothetical protein